MLTRRTDVSKANPAMEYHLSLVPGGQACGAA